MLAQVFQVLNENKVTLVSVRSVGQQTEQAYLDLVEKEETRGFTRLYSAGGSGVRQCDSRAEVPGGCRVDRTISPKN